MKCCTETWGSSEKPASAWSDRKPEWIRGLSGLGSEAPHRLGAEADPGTVMAALLIRLNIELISCCVSVQTWAPSHFLFSA